jgi:hypothetical protein
MMRLNKVPDHAARPPVTAPIKPVTSISNAGLSVFNISKEALAARMWLLPALLSHAKMPHKRKIAVNPHKKDSSGFWYKTEATRNEAIAMLHQGRYNPAAKASNAVNSTDTINFIKNPAFMMLFLYFVKLIFHFTLLSAVSFSFITHNFLYLPAAHVLTNES